MKCHRFVSDMKRPTRKHAIPNPNKVLLKPGPKNLTIFDPRENTHMRW
jgi:hypothetical protein